MLTLEHVSREFRKLGGGRTRALDDVSFEVPDRAIVGLVGESGSGKTTALRCIVGLDRPDAGVVRLDGVDIRSLRSADRKVYRKRVQLVSQDPGGSLNPRQTVEEIVEEGLIIHRLRPTAAARRDRVAELLELVGLDAGDMSRRIRSFSGGQKQRIAIARALAVEPDTLVCDEPTSALDVSVQAQVLTLLQDLQASFGLSVLFVSHDLSVVRYLCSEVSVIHLGRIVEHGPTQTVFNDPQDDYTRALLDAVPRI